MNNQQLNVFEEPLEECSCNPITGFFRSGCCETSDQDIGNHTVCALMTKELLLFSFEKGNDLISAVPQFDFPGLKPGDKWCLCANRWLEAYEENIAPSIISRATNIRALEIITIEKIKEFAIDLS